MANATLANPMRCFGCNGSGKDLVADGNHGLVSMGRCPRCKGRRELCADCHKPAGACECEAIKNCETCGKLPWACGCER